MLSTGSGRHPLFLANSDFHLWTFALLRRATNGTSNQARMTHVPQPVAELNEPGSAPQRPATTAGHRVRRFLNLPHRLCRLPERAASCKPRWTTTSNLTFFDDRNERHKWNQSWPTGVRPISVFGPPPDVFDSMPTSPHAASAGGVLPDVFHRTKVGGIWCCCCSFSYVSCHVSLTPHMVCR